MFELGFNEFLRNLKRNIMIILQMIALYIILIFVVSNFIEQYRLFGGIKNIFDETGIVCSKYSMESSEIVNESELRKILSKVENINYTKKCTLYELRNDWNVPYDFSIDMISNNPQFITYKPNLMEGKWCEEGSYKQGIINVCVSDNFPFKINVDETIEYAGYKFYVTGIFSSKEMIYGIKTEFSCQGDAGYLEFYDNVMHRNENWPYYLFVASYEDFIREVSIEDTDYENLMFVDFEDDITEEEFNENLKKLKMRYGHNLSADVFKYSVMYEYSLKYMEIKVMPLLMLLLIITIVVLVSIFVSSDINIHYERKNYGIYFICGNNWKKTFILASVNWGILNLVSILVAVCCCVFINSTKIFSGVTILFSWLHIIMIIFVTILVQLVTILVPFFVLRNIQPVSILKENDK